MRVLNNEAEFHGDKKKQKRDRWKTIFLKVIETIRLSYTSWGTN